jgi:hypothetical protein
MLRRQCAERSRTPALRTRYGQVYGVFRRIAAWHVRWYALSASPSRASWHDSCRRAARQMLMRTASWHVRLARHAEMCSTLYSTCHHAVRRVQRARPAYAAFSAICSQSSAMPAGSLSDVLGVSTAAPTGEMVPKWEWLWRRGNRRLGMEQSGNGREWERGLSGNEPRWERGVSGIPSFARASVPAPGSSDVQMPRAPKSAPTVRS